MEGGGCEGRGKGRGGSVEVGGEGGEGEDFGIGRGMGDRGLGMGELGWTYATSGCGTLYPEKVTRRFCKRRARTRLPRVWSSLLKVKMEVEGIPEPSLLDGLHHKSKAPNPISVVSWGRRRGLTGINLLGNLLLALAEQEQLEPFRHVSLCCWLCAAGAVGHGEDHVGVVRDVVAEMGVVVYDIGAVVKGGRHCGGGMQVRKFWEGCVQGPLRKTPSLESVTFVVLRCNKI